MYQTENKSVQMDLRCVKIEQSDSFCAQLSGMNSRQFFNLSWPMKYIDD